MEHTSSLATSEVEMSTASLFERALKSDFGIELAFPTEKDAARSRRGLYAFAAKHSPLNEIGVSILLRGTKLKLIKHSAAKKDRKIAAISISALSAMDMPKIVHVRGPKRRRFPFGFSGRIPYNS